MQEFITTNKTNCIFALIVTLTTDWQNGDYNIGRLKACILALCSDANIIDITHFVNPFDSLQAAFIIKNSYKFFPKGSIHIIGVNSEPSAQNPIAIMFANGHYFIGANNGMLSIICENADYAIELPYDLDPQGFRALSVFSQAVKLISENADLQNMDNNCEIKQSLTGHPSCYESRIDGKVIYIDAYGNAITNIDKATFDRICNNRNFEISAQSNYVRIQKISNYYDDVKNGAMLAIFNSIGLLELAINRGNFSKLQGIDVSSTIIMIKFT